jgi:hypothetical protein
MIQQIISDYLFNEEMKVKIVQALNENVNIPIISEKTEEKILSAIWDTIEEVLKKAVLKG